MSWLGKILSAPVKIANAPLQIFEKLVEKSAGLPPAHKDDRFLSAPLSHLSDAIEEVCDDE